MGKVRVDMLMIRNRKVPHASTPTANGRYRHAPHSGQCCKAYYA